MNDRGGRLDVLLADDQPLVRAGLRMMLDAEPDMRVVAEASTGLEAVDLARRHHVDVVLMDIQMPELDGVAATRRLLAAPGPQPRVLVLTTFDLDEYVFEALHAGASGYLLKTIRPEDLAPAVRVVAAGDSLLAPPVTRRLIARFAAAPVRPDEARLAVLTPRERDVLLALGRGRSNDEIAAELYLGRTTVKTHVAHVLAKLGLRDRTQAVILAYEAGLIRPGA